MSDSQPLSFSEAVSRLGPDALSACPALAHAVYQLACRGGPYADVVASSVGFRSSSTAQQVGPTTSIADILTAVATQWSLSSARDAAIPAWKVAARGEALLPDGFDGVRTAPDWATAAATYFADTRRKTTKALVENTVGSPEANISKNLRHVLRSGSLVDSSDQLTGAGLRFCLSHPYRQAWCLATACFAAMEDHSVGQRGSLEMAAVLFHLDPSVAYSFPVNHQAMRSLLGLLASAGLVFLLQKDGQKLFFVASHFALGIASSGEIIGASSAVGGGPASSDGTIIIETNFRLYLYGKEALLLDVVKQFASVDVVISDCLTCCRITRASFMDAAQRGIRAAQVIEFLALKAHPVMRQAPQAAAAGGGVVPQSICDQLLMWEQEWHRVTAVSDCVVITGATDVVLRNLAALGLSPVAVSRSAVAVKEADYNRMSALLQKPI